MDTEEIKQTTETKHLGIKRNNKNNIDIEDGIKLARRTIYALLGHSLSSANVGATTLMFPISAPMFERFSAFSMLLLYLLYRTVESFAPCLIPCFTSSLSH
jgi:hypothetical protein